MSMTADRFGVFNQSTRTSCIRIMGMIIRSQTFLLVALGSYKGFGTVDSWFVGQDRFVERKAPS